MLFGDCALRVLFRLVYNSWGSDGLAHDKRRTRLFGQQTSLLGGSHQGLRDFLQVGVFRMGNGRFHVHQLSSISARVQYA